MSQRLNPFLPLSTQPQPTDIILTHRIVFETVNVTRETIEKTLAALQQINATSLIRRFEEYYDFFFNPAPDTTFPVSKEIDLALHGEVMAEILKCRGRTSNEAACLLLMQVLQAAGFRMRTVGKEPTSSLGRKPPGQIWQDCATKKGSRYKTSREISGDMEMF